MRTSRAAALLLVLPLMAACAKAAGPGAGSPSVAPSSPAGTPSPLDGASCEPWSGGSSSNVPDFVQVEPEHERGVDRIVFRFEPKDANATEPPSYNVQFVSSLATDGEGSPVSVQGSAFVQVNFSAIGVNLATETPQPVYTGPQDFRPGYTTLQEASELGDFEAVITWGLGLSFRACPVVYATADALTIEFPSL